MGSVEPPWGQADAPIVPRTSPLPAVCLPSGGGCTNLADSLPSGVGTSVGLSACLFAYVCVFDVSCVHVCVCVFLMVCVCVYVCVFDGVKREGLLSASSIIYSSLLQCSVLAHIHRPTVLRPGDTTRTSTSTTVCETITQLSMLIFQPRETHCCRDQTILSLLLYPQTCSVSPQLSLSPSHIRHDI